MPPKTFLKKEAIGYGWQKMKEFFGFFVGLLIIAWLISVFPAIFGLITKIAKVNLPLLTTIIQLVSVIFQIIVSIGLIKIALAIYDGSKPKFSDLFNNFQLFFKYLLGTILYGLIISAGFILLIVPGIIWTIKFQFFAYFIVDKGLGPIEALKKSGALTKDVRWNLLWFSLLTTLINFAGAIVLLIGLFATLPTVMMAYIFVYRKLLAQTETAQAPASGAIPHPQSPLPPA